MPPVSPSDMRRLLQNRFTGTARFPGPAKSHPDACETTERVRVSGEEVALTFRRIASLLDEPETDYVEVQCAAGSIKWYEVHRVFRPTGEGVVLQESA